jgi:eukaryotic-like serine/threonine-protein kinase
MLICQRCHEMYPPGSYERCPRDGTPLYLLGHEGPTQKQWGVGDTIAHKYMLLAEMNKKRGAGKSFKAEQVRLKRVVELRLLPSDGMMLPGDQARFEREVSTWARMRSPYVVRLFDHGFTERDEPYIVLEYTELGSLDDLLNRNARLGYSEGVRLSEHLLQALDAAHQAQVLHRDVNPSAVVLHTLADGSSQYRLTGFAVAKHLGAEQDDPTAITMTGQVICDPAYMAPESIMLGVLEPRTDLYALGVTLYEAFTGRRPFPGATLSELLEAHVKGKHTPIEELRPDIPLPLKAFLERLIHRDPQQRFSSAMEALTDLRLMRVDFKALDEAAISGVKPRPATPPQIVLTPQRGLAARWISAVRALFARASRLWRS